MLSVQIDIVPWGDEQKRARISTLTISRTTNHADPENYNCTLTHNTGRVETFEVNQHTRKDGALELVRRALQVACNVEDADGRPS